jgi:hypothetical protein
VIGECVSIKHNDSNSMVRQGGGVAGWMGSLLERRRFPPNTQRVK